MVMLFCDFDIVLTQSLVYSSEIIILLYCKMIDNKKNSLDIMSQHMWDFIGYWQILVG